jgi:hypothetical protein
MDKFEMAMAKFEVAMAKFEMAMEEIKVATAKFICITINRKLPRQARHFNQTSLPAIDV